MPLQFFFFYLIITIFYIFRVSRPTVMPYLCMHLSYRPKHPYCFSLPPLADMRASHVSFSFKLERSSSFNLLSLHCPTRGSARGAWLLHAPCTRVGQQQGLAYARSWELLMQHTCVPVGRQRRRLAHVWPWSRCRRAGHGQLG